MYQKDVKNEPSVTILLHHHHHHHAQQACSYYARCWSLGLFNDTPRSNTPTTARHIDKKGETKRCGIEYHITEYHTKDGLS